MAISWRTLYGEFKDFTKGKVSDVPSMGEAFVEETNEKLDILKRERGEMASSFWDKNKDVNDPYTSGFVLNTDAVKKAMQDVFLEGITPATYSVSPLTIVDGDVLTIDGEVPKTEIKACAWHTLKENGGEPKDYCSRCDALK